jgi:hypothetical protein
MPLTAQAALPDAYVADINGFLVELCTPMA